MSLSLLLVPEISRDEFKKARREGVVDCFPRKLENVVQEVKGTTRAGHSGEAGTKRFP